MERKHYCKGSRTPQIAFPKTWSPSINNHATGWFSQSFHILNQASTKNRNLKLKYRRPEVDAPVGEEHFNRSFPNITLPSIYYLNWLFMSLFILHLDLEVNPVSNFYITGSSTLCNTAVVHEELDNGSYIMQWTATLNIISWVYVYSLFENAFLLIISWNLSIK